MAGNLGSARIMIFRNKRKNADNQPDYEIFLAERRREAAPVQHKPTAAQIVGIEKPSTPPPNFPPPDDFPPENMLSMNDD